MALKSLETLTLSQDRLTLAIDTSEKKEAERLTKLAKSLGIYVVKFGLELWSATSLSYCSQLAEENDIAWIADAKLKDKPRTIGRTVKNFAGLSYLPLGITVYADA